jgi:hypothetical protein
MVDEQGHDIPDVLGAYLDYLQLRSEQVGERDRLNIEFESVLEIETMAHVEDVEEDVGPPLQPQVVEDEALVPLHGIESVSGHVTEALEELGDSGRLP